jgi:hypothetical protein
MAIVDGTDVICFNCRKAFNLGTSFDDEALCLFICAECNRLDFSPPALKGQPLIGEFSTHELRKKWLDRHRAMLETKSGVYG